jgi:hypothetical protein
MLTVVQLSTRSKSLLFFPLHLLLLSEPFLLPFPQGFSPLRLSHSLLDPDWLCADLFILLLLNRIGLTFLFALPLAYP